MVSKGESLAPLRQNSCRPQQDLDPTQSKLFKSQPSSSAADIHFYYFYSLFVLQKGSFHSGHPRAVDKMEEIQFAIEKKIFFFFQLETVEVCL